MKPKLLIAALGGALIGVALSRKLPLVTVIVNVGNQGSIDIKIDNATHETQIPEMQPAISESALEISSAESQAAES